MKDHLAQMKAKLDAGEAQLLDVREPHEWDAGHLVEARLVPLSDLQQGAAPEDLDRGKTAYVHCRSGNRVKRAAPLLEQLGLTVVQVSEGFEELAREGFEVAGP